MKPPIQFSITTLLLLMAVVGLSASTYQQRQWLLQEQAWRLQEQARRQSRTSLTEKELRNQYMRYSRARSDWMQARNELAKANEHAKALSARLLEFGVESEVGNTTFERMRADRNNWFRLYMEAIDRINILRAKLGY